MEINKFIELSISQVKKGIDEFNKKTTDAKAYYPEFIDFEVFVDSNGDVSNEGTQQVIIKVSMTGNIHPL